MCRLHRFSIRSVASNSLKRTSTGRFLSSLGHWKRRASTEPSILTRKHCLASLGKALTQLAFSNVLQATNPQRNQSPFAARGLLRTYQKNKHKETVGVHSIPIACNAFYNMRTEREKRGHQKPRSQSQLVSNICQGSVAAAKIAAK